MKKLTISMICSEFPPVSAGIGNAVFQLANALMEKNINVIIFTRGSWFKFKNRTYKGIKVYEVPFIPFLPPFHITYHGFFMQKLFNKLENNIDLIHYHSPLIPIIITKKPSIVTVHSTWYNEAKAFTKIIDWYSLAVFLFKEIFIKYENKILKNANAVISISDGIKKELIDKYNINSNVITVIKNSINLKKFQSNSAKTSISNFNILTISRLVYRKGIFDLIIAAKLIIDILPQVKFTLIGTGPLLKKIKSEVKKAGLINHFDILGSVAHNKISNYIANSNIVIIPSHYEGLPLTLLETMAMGKPIIATNIAGINEVINHSYNGILVPAKKGDILAKETIKLLNNSNLQNKLSQNALKTVKTFDRKFNTNNTINLYKQVLKGSTYDN